MDNQTTGIFIASKRKELGLSQKQLAEQLHITDKAVSKWETGNGAPDISNLIPLSEVLGVSVVELLNGHQIEEDDIKIQSDRIIVENMQISKTKTKKRIIQISIIVALIVALLTTALNFTWYAYWGRRHSVLYTVNTVYVYCDSQTDSLYHITYDVTVQNWKLDLAPHTYKLVNDLRGEYACLDFTGASDYFTADRSETRFQIRVDFNITQNGWGLPSGIPNEEQVTEAIRLSRFMALDEDGNEVESAALYMTDNPDAEIIFVNN